MLQEGGIGVPKDEAREVELYRKACDGGYPQACARLGLAYFKGELGLSEDAAKAKPLLEKGCSGGITQACGPLAPPPEKELVPDAKPKAAPPPMKGDPAAK